MERIKLSLRVATVATIVATPLGIGRGVAVANGGFLRARRCLDAMIFLTRWSALLRSSPDILLLLTFGRRGLVGAWLDDHLGNRAGISLDRRGVAAA